MTLVNSQLIYVCLLNENKINLEFSVHFRHLYCCKDIVLRRSTSGSLGFSIVGGQEELNCNQSFFIRSIVEGTPAYNDGRIRYRHLEYVESTIVRNHALCRTPINNCLAQFIKYNYFFLPLPSFLSRLQHTNSSLLLFSPLAVETFCWK